MRRKGDDDTLLMELLHRLYEIQHIALVASEGEGIYADYSRMFTEKILDVGFGAVVMLYGYADMTGILVTQKQDIRIRGIFKPLKELGYGRLSCIHLFLHLLLEIAEGIGDIRDIAA